MPTYDYICKECGYEFEEFHGINDEPVKVCPKCGHMSVERKISGGSGLIFKGSGFYITDYSNGKSNATANSTSNSSASGKSSSETQSTDTTQSKKSNKSATKK